MAIQKPYKCMQDHFWGFKQDFDTKMSIFGSERVEICDVSQGIVHTQFKSVVSEFVTK